MRNNRKGIIIGPSLDKKGGVSNFYSVAKKYFSDGISYWEYEVCLNNKFVSILLSTLVWLPIVLIRVLFNTRHTIVLNPSLMPISIARNALIALVYRFSGGKDLYVFWRGWNEKNEYLMDYSFVRSSLLSGSKQIILNFGVGEFLNKRMGIDKERIYKISTIVDDVYFTELGGSRVTDVKNIRFLYLSRVESYKGIYETCKLINKNNFWHLRIYGSGREVNNIVNNEIPKFKGRINFYGYVNGEDKITAFQSGDIYILLSASEGMPNSLLEAMAMGLPVVCTDVGAMRDFFQDNLMGIKVSYPVDVDRLAVRLEELLSDEEKLRKIQIGNRAFAEQHFKASVVIRKLEEILLN